MRAYIFPGQGSQAVGMGRDLYDAFAVAREVFEEVDEALKEKLSALIFEGPAETLTLTANTQPALMAMSMAVVQVLENEVGLKIADARCVAGHSLGEYAALCAAGSLSLADTARLLRIRGEAMQAAVPVGVGAMAALIGVDLDGAQAAIAQTHGEGICEIANDNAPGQVVISGDATKIETICANAKNLGIKLAKKLPVSAPFHSSLMQPAAERMAEALADADIQEPAVPLVANVTAEAVSDPIAIRDLLVKQVTGRVRWTQSVHAMVNDGVTDFVELGAGKVLSGLVRRIEKDVTARSVATPEELEALA
ncbi:MAG: ACP S-malonyltransferase [Pseudomonadota bacterium]